MRLYIGDYLKDTLHLSTFEHGVYFLLIIAYWTNGSPLPDDNVQLANIARLTLDQWLAVRPRMTDRFFQVQGGQWHHKRIELELLKAKADLETKHERGKKGADARWQKKRAKNAAGNACALPEQCQSESQSESQSQSELEAEAERVIPVVPALDDGVEEELMRRTRDVLGDAEMNKNGGLCALACAKTHQSTALSSKKWSLCRKSNTSQGVSGKKGSLNA
ncbi:MAG: DUF1376 domain-containing protein [Verrucomicrobia subdivision 3 bacterium]|nr:DUF1376 domain-containing protein [Limisphaerales bacterium]